MTAGTRNSNPTPSPRSRTNAVEIQKDNPSSNEQAASSKRKSKKERHRTSLKMETTTSRSRSTSHNQDEDVSNSNSMTPKKKKVQIEAKDKINGKSDDVSATKKMACAPSLDASFGTSDHTAVTMEETEHSLAENDDGLFGHITKEPSAVVQTPISSTAIDHVSDKEKSAEAKKQKKKKKERMKEKRQEGRENALNAILRAKLTMLSKEKQVVERDFEVAVAETEKLQSYLSEEVDRANGLATRVEELKKLLKEQSTALTAKERTILAQRELIQSLEKHNEIERLQWKKKLERKKESVRSMRVQLQQLESQHNRKKEKDEEVTKSPKHVQPEPIK
jgi:hypothetical protein